MVRSSVESLHKKNVDYKVTGSLWIECEGERFFGPGRVELLQKIDEIGSINKAAERGGEIILPRTIRFPFCSNQVGKSLLKHMVTARILTDTDTDRIIEMAWEDRTPFEAIEMQFGLMEKEVIELMRTAMKPSSFRMWRRRMQGRNTKHSSLRLTDTTRFKCNRQKQISGNKISKR